MSEIFANTAFLAIGGMTAGAALMVVLFRNLLHAAIALFFCLGGVAGLYILLGADFLGMAQLLVYAGGILVLIIFGVFLTARIYDVKVDLKGKGLPEKWGVAAAVGLFVVMWSVISKTDWPMQPGTYASTTEGLGNLFLTKYLLAFELVSILLLFTMVGSLLLIRNKGEGR